jgi:transposase
LVGRWACSDLGGRSTIGPQGLLKVRLTHDLWRREWVRWSDVDVPSPHPQEFRDDVAAVARKGEASIVNLAADFGISEPCRCNWLRQADGEDGLRPGATAAENAELREVKRKIRLLEQGNEVLRGAAYLSLANLKLGQCPKGRSRWSWTLLPTASPSR